MWGGAEPGCCLSAGCTGPGSSVVFRDPLLTPRCLYCPASAADWDCTCPPAATLPACSVVELAFIDGSWQPARLRLFRPPSVATTHTGSMEWREEGKAGSEGSAKGGTARHAAGGAPIGSRTSGSFDSRVGSGRVVRLTLPPTEEGVEQ